MFAGLDQLIVGVACKTLIVATAVAVVLSVISVGVNVTLSVWPLPAFSTVPEAGV